MDTMTVIILAIIALILIVCAVGGIVVWRLTKDDLVIFPPNQNMRKIKKEIKK